jgi:hypothetical protein
VWHVCGTPGPRSPRPTGTGSEETAPDLHGDMRAGDRDRTGMTSLEGVPHHAVMLADLGIQVPVSGCWLPLLAPVNGTPMAR